MKTNAVRLLEDRKIPFELRSYDVDPNDLTAETVAGKIGMPPEQVFKTLVVKGNSGGIYLAVVPGDSELNLKMFARLSGVRSSRR
jgi:Cys-tRNA(Pro)/Cys-tRNA(Cys) deacylase